tara:strand:+ start:2607 stop:2975 length:369 start_codon:yes stop_codon:yes gene_type:complete
MDFDIMLEPEILEWCEKYGSITTFTFMIYGQLPEDQVDLLGKGVKLHLLAEGEQPPMMVFMRDVEEEEARRLSGFRGINLSIIVAESRQDLETVIVEVITDCLRYLRLKNEYLGVREATSHV